MRIAYFTGNYPRATDTFIQREVAGLRRRGIEIETFSVRRVGSDHDVGPAILEEKRNTTYLLPVSPAGLIRANLASMLRTPRRYLGALRLALRTAKPGLRALAYQLFYFQEAVVLGQALLRRRIDHIHNHFGDSSGTVTLLVSCLTGIGYSITVHGPHLFFDPLHWSLSEKVRYSKFIVCISHYCQSQLMLFSEQSSWERLRIVHCGVELGSYPALEVRATARNLLYTGRLAAEKGLPVLFEALRLLAAKGYDIQLTLVGDGAERAALEALARRLGIAGQLVFTGYLPQYAVREHLQRSDMFILPSFAEGVPVSLMEAMACGVPVLATYVGGVAELVVSGETGLVVPPADSAALYDAIARYIDDVELRRKVSRQARAMIATHFNLDVELDKLASLFRTQGAEVGSRD